MSGYYQRDIYQLLAKRGPMRTRDITHRLGLPYKAGSKHPTKAAAQTIQKMVAKGLLERVGLEWRVIHGTRAPKCGRGKSPGSLLALRSHSRDNMAKLNAKRGRHIKPVATTALEQCWGWLPSISPELQAQNESDMLLRGAVRPKEPEAA